MNETIWKCKLSPLCWHQDFGIKLLVCKNRIPVKTWSFWYFTRLEFSFSSLAHLTRLVWQILFRSSGDKRAERERENEWMSEWLTEYVMMCIFLLFGFNKNVNASFSHMLTWAHAYGRATVNLAKKDWKDMNEKWLWPIAYRYNIVPTLYSTAYIYKIWGVDRQRIFGL